LAPEKKKSDDKRQNECHLSGGDGDYLENG
jgi:hypothetical protein